MTIIIPWIFLAAYFVIGFLMTIMYVYTHARYGWWGAWFIQGFYEIIPVSIGFWFLPILFQCVEWILYIPAKSLTGFFKRIEAKGAAKR